jgi:flavin-dependent dehydrogenase
VTLPDEASNPVSAPLVGAGWLCVGDAAMSFDPLASYGVSFALGSACEAAAAILADLEGERFAMARYASHLARAHAAYRIARADCYSQANRNEPFWKARAHAKA